MRLLWRWLKRLALALGLVVVGLLLPPAYVELACRGGTAPEGYTALITDPDWQRAESRTLTTYPEWHIVHAYDDYARMIRSGDPHDFGYFRAIAGFWSALCPLKERAAAMGGMTSDSKATIYTIGVSFSAEFLAKAAYEETVGRVATWVRGAERSPLDDLSATMAADYAIFLQQVPWYRWDFGSDVERLENAAGPGFRDRERLFALRNEFLAKAWYARQIEAAVGELGADALKMRSLVKNIAVNDLLTIPGVQVVGERPGGLLIETDRYRAFTRIAERIADAGGDFTEIAGNDEILFTVISSAPQDAAAIFSFARQGYDDHRHLILVPVSELAARLRSLDGRTLEHIHDY